MRSLFPLHNLVHEQERIAMGNSVKNLLACHDYTVVCELLFNRKASTSLATMTP